MKHEVAAGAIAAASGLIVWVVINAVTGEREAWDSALYMGLGVPILYGVAAALAYHVPRRSWRWAVLPFAAQFLWMIATEPMGPLAVLGLGFMVVLAFPAAIFAKIAAEHRRAKTSTNTRTTESMR
jgi:RsiW-degrading membrane proteinase PrsW (M82 family)